MAISLVIFAAFKILIQEIVVWIPQNVKPFHLVIKHFAKRFPVIFFFGRNKNRRAVHFGHPRFF